MLVIEPPVLLVIVVVLLPMTSVIVSPLPVFLVMVAVVCSVSFSTEP